LTFPNGPLVGPPTRPARAISGAEFCIVTSWSFWNHVRGCAMADDDTRRRDRRSRPPCTLSASQSHLPIPARAAACKPSTQFSRYTS
jgi:hypothetical protein